MSIFAPAARMRDAVALATAASHADEPEGWAKLIELVQAMPCEDVAVAAVLLARLVGRNFGDQWLTDTGVIAAGDGVVSI